MVDNTVTNIGVLARGKDAGPDLILAGNANIGSGDDGRLHSDPAYAGSDLFLVSNDAIRLELDNDTDVEDADFEICNKDDTLIFDEGGDITMGGAGWDACCPKSGITTILLTLIFINVKLNSDTFSLLQSILYMGVSSFEQQEGGDEESRKSANPNPVLQVSICKRLLISGVFILN